MNNIIISNKKPIVIGRQGENNVTTIRFSIDALFPNIQNATYGLLHQRHGDAAPYPVATMAIGGYVNWVINSGDVGNVGNGTAQLTAYKDGAVAKSIIFTTITLTSMGTTDAPDPVQIYIDRIVRAGQEAVNAATDAEESAEEAAASAEAAAGSAEAAAGSAEAAAGSAEAAAGSASDASDSATQAGLRANSAEGFRNQARTYANNAYNSATQAGVSASSAAQARTAAQSAAASAQQILDDIPDTVETELAEAKQSGEFDGPRGYGVYGGSNVIIANWTDGTHTENYCVDKVDAPDAGIGDFILGKRVGEISLMKVAREDANHLFGDGVMSLIGQMGQDGEDGYSPTVAITTITGGHRVTITDKNGAHNFDVMDGEVQYADIAPVFSTSSSYKAGDYVFYDGALYCFTADHAAGAWNASHATAVQLAEDVGDLKSAITEETRNLNSSPMGRWGNASDGKIYSRGNAYYGMENFINVTAGTTYTFSFGGFPSSNMSWTYLFIDVSENVVARAGYQNLTTRNMTAPTGAVKLNAFCKTANDADLDITDNMYLQIERGSTATEYIRPISAIDAIAREEISKYTITEGSNWEG